MNNNSTAGVVNYDHLLQQISAILNLTLPQIRNKYADYPYCLMDYFEKDVTEKLIEIRLDEEKITLHCMFNTEEKCNLIILYHDKNDALEEFVSYLKDTYYYDFIYKRWEAPGCHIKVKMQTSEFNELCFVFYC